MNSEFQEQSGSGNEWESMHRGKAQSSKKIIEKNEGEYIDYEELE